MNILNVFWNGFICLRQIKMKNPTYGVTWDRYFGEDKQGRAVISCMPKECEPISGVDFISFRKDLNRCRHVVLEVFDHRTGHTITNPKVSKCAEVQVLVCCYFIEDIKQPTANQIDFGKNEILFGEFGGEKAVLKCTGDLEMNFCCPPQCPSIYCTYHFLQKLIINYLRHD